MITRTTLFTVLTFALLSFMPSDKSTIEFSYPKNKEAVFTMTSDKFKKFSKEWRDKDYYYMSKDGEDNFICSVLFFKLNKSELKDLKGAEKETGVPLGSPVYPLAFFSLSSETKSLESNEETWGDPKGEFMFRQVDIKEFSGQKINQKNMFAYTMFGEDIYVSLHISKVLCTPEDSTIMREILDGLKKKK